MIVEFDGEGEQGREIRLMRVFCRLSGKNRFKVRKLVDHEGHLSVFAERVDAVFCANIQMAWEKECEYTFEVFDVRDGNNPKLQYSTL